MSRQTHKCTMCPNSFDADLFGTEKQKDIILLCPTCYRKAHDKASELGLLVVPGPGPNVGVSTLRYGLGSQWAIVMDTLWPVSKEKPCNICGKSNDTGVRSCWYCGNPPSKSKYVSGHVEREEFRL